MRIYIPLFSCTEFAREMEVVVDLVSNRPALAALRDDLIQEAGAVMTAKTDASRNAGQPCFQRNAKRLREENRDIEWRLLLEKPGGRQKGLRWKRQHLIDFRDQLPDRGELRRRGDG